MHRLVSHSLQRKLSIMMIISTMIPLLFLGVFSYVTSSRMTERMTKQTGTDTLRRIHESLRVIAQDVQDMSIFLTGDNDVQQYMRGFDFDAPERSRILAMTMNLIQSKDYISNISLYSQNKLMPLQTNSVYYSELSSMLADWDLSGKTWTSLYINRTMNGSENVLSFLRGVRSMQNLEPLGFISISISESALTRYIAEPNFGVGGGDLVLLDRHGVVVSGNRQEWLAKRWSELFPHTNPADWSGSSGSFTYDREDGKLTVLYDRIPGPDWTLVGLVPYELYSRENRYIWLLTATAVSLAAALTTGLIVFFVRYVTKPLKVISRLLMRLDPNEPMPLYQYESPDEVGRLVGSYNQLGEHIRRLKEQVIRLETRKKEADMRSLQAQINPHFLYNTLSSIHWIALMSEDQRMANMVGALSDFLRFSLNKGKDYCPVRQEINHVKNYAVIQQIRFPNRFDVSYDVDPRTLEYPMLKLLLQPLVENAMIHGIQKDGRRGAIYIGAALEAGGIRFTVQDDGAGMKAEDAARLTEELARLPTDDADSSTGSYGLRNVNERLLLHYGKAARLAIQSEEGVGTRVTFIIPAKENAHENHDRGR